MYCKSLLYDETFHNIHRLLIHSIQIDEFALILKRNLQPHYKVISGLLAKSGTINDEGLLLEPRTDKNFLRLLRPNVDWK